MLKRAVEARPGCDGIILGGHGLFTWGTTQRECYVSSITTIDQMGQFIEEHARRANRPAFGGPAVTGVVADRDAAVADVFPYLRGAVSSNRRVIGHFDGSADALAFANSTWAEELCGLGTSCPDHFLRTRISPMFIPWDPATGDAGAIRDAHRRADRQVSRGLRGLLQGVRGAGVAGAARQQPVGGRDPGPRACSGSARTSARRASRPSSSSTPST